MVDLIDFSSVPGLALAAIVLGPLVWLSWWKPTIAFLVALAALAIQPEVSLDQSVPAGKWGIHHTLLIFALAINALRYGVRLGVNWPFLSLLAVFGLGLLFGDPHPKLSPVDMLVSLVMLALPWSFTQVVMAPGSRRSYAMMIALAPILSVALGMAFQLAGIRSVAEQFDEYYRLRGAVGISADLALLGFAGFAVALHESTRPKRRFAVYLLAANLVIIILTGTRMAIIASAVLLMVYLWLSPDLRQRMDRHRGKMIFGAGIVAAALLFYLPALMTRTFEGPEGAIALSGRDELWRFYYEEFLLSPVFGRGLGAGFAAMDWLPSRLPTPHNEYLHLLVIGGLVGFVLCMTAIACWYRQLVQTVSANDRVFTLALIPAFALYAVTENVIILPSIFGLYVYLGALLTRRGASSKQPTLGNAFGATDTRASRRAVATHAKVIGPRISLLRLPKREAND